MRVTVDQVTRVSEGVWSAKMNPQQLIRLSTPVRQDGVLNLIMISRPSYDSHAKSLQFDLDSAVLLNLGNSFDTLFIDSLEKDILTPISETKPQLQEQYVPAGDKLFLEKLKSLPKQVGELGELLLAEVRKKFPGELVFHKTSGKYVESPDNFWVVRIQPRAKSLRIVVYGRPEQHLKYDSIKMKNDMMGYSSFVIDSLEQIDNAIDVIYKAKLLKGKR